ncbi:MAG: sulfatase [Rikenellaceae bacterium]
MIQISKPLVLTATTSLLTIAASAAERPNIIIFLVDDMGVMDTSLPFITDSDGNVVREPLNDWYRTPNMERLADRGVRFSTFFAQSVSSPTRASIITGQNSTRHGVTQWINSSENNRGDYGPTNWNWTGIKQDCPTLPKMLKDSGYKTIHIGKAHFGAEGSEGEFPQNLGFDVNIAGGGMGSPGSYLGLNDFGAKKGKNNAVPDLEQYHGTDIFLTEALTLEAKKEIEKASKEEEPFFLYMAHYAVHAPFEDDKRFIDNYDESKFGKKAASFAALIEGMDKSLGDIMDCLENLEIAENTLILFVGDNGSDAYVGDFKGHYSSAPLRGKKGTEYEGGVRVPFIASWAKRDETSKVQRALPIKENGVQLQFGSVMDLYPTILNMAGAKFPENHVLDGYDLAKQLKGEKNEQRSDKLIMHFPHDHRGDYYTSYRSGNWKLIYRYNPEMPTNPQYELYNLEIDPFENDNVATTEMKKTAAMIKEMAEQLEKENALYPEDKNHRPIKPILLFNS